MASKDYKTPQRHAPARSGHPMIVGIVIGVVLGLATALGVALYFAKVPGPFVQRDDPARASEAAARQQASSKSGASPRDAMPSKSETQTAPPPQDATTARATAQHPGEKPRFEFYGILAGTEKPAKDKEVKAVTASPEKPVEHFYLQIGAFPRADDADNLKAKLALAGIEAKIKTAELADGKVWHRVRVGPFENVGEVDRVRARLKENQMQGALIKVQEKP